MAAKGPRILGGRLRGRPLRVGPGMRPTEGRVREALFNIWGDDVVGCRYMDLFAGSGAMGFEALSRGATAVTWVEKQGSAVASIRRLARELEAELDSPTMHVVRAELPKQFGRATGQAPAGGWDIVYADPPYAFDAYDALVAEAARFLARGGCLAVEHSRRVEIEPCGDLALRERRVWGDCAVTFFERS